MDVDAEPAAPVVAPAFSEPELADVVMGLRDGVMRDGTPVESYLEHRGYDCIIFFTLLQLTSHIEVPGLVGSALIGLHRLFSIKPGHATDVQSLNSGVVACLAHEATTIFLCETLDAVKPLDATADSTPLASSDVAMALLEVLTWRVLPTPVAPPVELCLLACARLLNIVTLHRSNQGILFTAFINLEMYTYACAWHHGKGVVRTFPIVTIVHAPH